MSNFGIALLFAILEATHSFLSLQRAMDEKQQVHYRTGLALEYLSANHNGLDIHVIWIC